MDEKGPDKPRAWRRVRLSRERRREQILKSAELQFAATGLRSTTTAALAKAAGISEAILYRHFGAKQKLFETWWSAIPSNVWPGWKAGSLRFPNLPPLECIDRMAEATILACADGEGNASVMVWALLEMPEFAADVYRGEIGATEAMWDSEIRNRFDRSGRPYPPCDPPGALRGACLHGVRVVACYPAAQSCNGSGTRAAVRGRGRGSRPDGSQILSGIAWGRRARVPAEDGVCRVS